MNMYAGENEFKYACYCLCVCALKSFDSFLALDAYVRTNCRAIAMMFVHLSVWDRQKVKKSKG